MGIKFDVFAVRGDDGALDVAATIEKFKAQLIEWDREKGQESNLIGSVIHALFDQYKGASLNTGYLINETLRRLNISDYEASRVLTQKVKDYVKDNTEGGVFGSKRGRDGGIYRVCDVT